jgi:hypothetical protein
MFAVGLCQKPQNEVKTDVQVVQFLTARETRP